MRTATLLAPVIAADRRLVAASRRVLPARRRTVVIDPEAFARAIEITNEEILDDLLYPADHGLVRALDA